MQTIIEPKTAAETSATVRVNAVPPDWKRSTNMPFESTIFCPGLATDETVTIQLTNGAGTDTGNMYDNSAIAQLTATNNVYVIRAAIPIKVVKSETAAETGVYIASPFDV